MTSFESLPSPLTPVEPDTEVPLPHVSWNPEWRPLLARFGRAAGEMRPVSRVAYERLPLWLRAKVTWNKLTTGHEGRGLYAITWHVPTNAVPDRGLRREMLQFAEAFYAYELPAQDAVILTGMLDDVGRDGGLHLLGWLRAAIAELSGEPSSAIAAPTGQTGDDDGSFALHSDMWIPALLFNIFNHAVPGQGASLLLPMDELWPIAEAVGMAAEAVEQMQTARVEAGECDYFEQFNTCMYDEKPWTEAIRQALFDVAIAVPMSPGQGYFVNDRTWLHGRTPLEPDALAPELREHRLYRLAYNNARLDRAAAVRRVEWDRIGKTAVGCKA